MKLDKTAGKLAIAGAKPKLAAKGSAKPVPVKAKVPKAGAMTPQAFMQEASEIHDELYGHTSIVEEQNFQMDAALVKFKEAAKRETANFANILDSEFWFCVCFESRAHKEEFLAKYGLTKLGDKYLDGHALAERLGKPLKTKRTAFHRQKATKGWDEFIDAEK